MKTGILIFGASGHAKVIIDIIEKGVEYNIKGIIDAQLPVGSSFFGYPVLGKDEELPVILQDEKIKGCIIAIGDNWIRQKIVSKIIGSKATIEMITAIHPSAVIGRNVSIGKGTVVMAGAIINPDSIVGEHSIINTGASVDHDCKLGNFISLAPGVKVGGNVTIGDFSVISIGATILHSVSIGAHTVIGGSALVNKHIDSFCIAYGIPAKVVRNREAGDKYL